MACKSYILRAKRKYNRINYDIDRFCEQLGQMANRLKVPAKWILATIAIETAYTFDHRIKNPASGAYGFFQCLPSTCRHLVEVGLLRYPGEIYNMDAYQQLALMEKYLLFRARERGLISRSATDLDKIKSFPQFYLLVFYPSAAKYADRPDYRVGSRYVASANPMLDTDKDGYITIKDIQQYYKKHFGFDIDTDIVISLAVAIIKTFV